MPGLHAPLAQIVAARRTPIGRYLGALAPLSAVELGVVAARAVLQGTSAVDHTIFGQARQAGSGPNPARQVSMGAGLPETVPAHTVNMACGSGLQALIEGSLALALGRAERVLVGGMESMSNVPHLLPGLRTGYRMGHRQAVDGMYRDGFDCPLCGEVMGLTAERLAQDYGISRGEQDTYALESQRRAAAAWEEGAFDAEVVAVAAADGGDGLDRDEHLRPGTTLQKLAQLSPVFAPDGSVTAGSSSGITDGAAALLLEPAGARRKPLADVLDFEVAGIDPARMGLGPVPATRRLLERNGLRLEDIDVVEVNEAFAAQVLACHRELHFDWERTNVWGGAIALGHPIGATGARIVTTLVHALRRRDGELGLATLCVSGGMGLSLLIRRGT